MGRGAPCLSATCPPGGRARSGWPTSTAWLVPALDATGVRATAPVVRERVRFWSVVARVETDAGRVWVKENAPSQAFEAALVQVVDTLVPDAVATPLAVDHDRGWLATADLGLPMWHDEEVPPVPDWVDVVQGYADGAAGARRPRRGRARDRRAHLPRAAGRRRRLGGGAVGRARAPCRTPTRGGSTTPRPPPSPTACRASATPPSGWPRAASHRRCSTTTCTWATRSGGPGEPSPTSTSATPCGPTR